MATTTPPQEQETSTPDADADTDHDARPDACSCRDNEFLGLPCFECFNDGFQTPPVHVGDIVKADWSDGHGAYDEIIGEVTAIHNSNDGVLVIINVDANHPECKGGDELRGGSHDAAATWIQTIIKRP